MKIIKKIQFTLTLLSMLTCFTTSADILDARNAYDNKDYESAFTQYMELARLGNGQARYNVAVMYFKGQGTDKDLAKAYGWAQLVDYETDNEFIDLVAEIEKKLNDQELEEAQSEAQKIKAQFGEDAIFSQLAPISYQSQNTENSENEYKLDIIKRPAPRYPVSELRRGTQGWVQVGFDVYPDGSVRNIYVIESIPEGVFDEVTVEAVEQFKFNVSFNDGVDPYPVTARQTIQYELAVKDKNKLTNLYQVRLEKLEKLAKQGHPDAQYYYALAASSKSLINKYIKLNDVEVNQWLLKSAQNGNLDAQYHLGQNILSGKGCQIEKQKGIDWIVHAADKGNAKAARKAYHLLTKNSQLNNTDYPPEHWLQKAADAGDPESQLEYAHFLAFNQPSAATIPMVQKYLKNYLKERDKSVKYHQVMAQLYTLENNEKKANKELKKAKKLAKKLGWEI